MLATELSSSGDWSLRRFCSDTILWIAGMWSFPAVHSERICRRIEAAIVGVWLSEPIDIGGLGVRPHPSDREATAPMGRFRSWAHTTPKLCPDLQKAQSILECHL